MSVWLWLLGLAYVCGTAALWPKTSRWVLRHDMEGRALNARLLRLRIPEADTVDYISAAVCGFMLALLWPIWGSVIVLSWLGMLLGKWLFPVLREGGGSAD